MNACMAEPPTTDQQARWRKRRRDIVLLIGSRNDARFEPEGADAKRMRLAAVRGEAASKRVPCPNGCDKGWKTDRFQRRHPCERCGGGEHVAEETVDGLLVTVGVPFPGRGWIEVDDYTGREAGSERTGVTVARTRMVLCDRCGGAGMWHGERCELCNGGGRREVAAEPLRAAHAATPRRADEEYTCIVGTRNDPVVVRRPAQLDSYQALDEALERLRAVWPFGRMLVHRVFEVGELREDELGPAVRKRLEAALRILDRLLPRRLRVPRAVVEAAERRGR